MPKREFTGGQQGTQLLRVLDGHRARKRSYDGMSEEEVWHDIDARRNIHDAEDFTEGDIGES